MDATEKRLVKSTVGALISIFICALVPDGMKGPDLLITFGAIWFVAYWVVGEVMKAYQMLRHMAVNKERDTIWWAEK